MWFAYWRYWRVSPRGFQEGALGNGVKAALQLPTSIAASRSDAIDLPELETILSYIEPSWQLLELGITHLHRITVPQQDVQYYDCLARLILATGFLLGEHRRYQIWPTKLLGQRQNV